MALPKWIKGDQQFITPKDAANFIGCSVDSIYHYLEKGPPEGLKSIKIRARPYRNDEKLTRKSRYRIPKIHFLKWAGFGPDGREI